MRRWRGATVSGSGNAFGGLPLKLILESCRADLVPLQGLAGLLRGAMVRSRVALEVGAARFMKGISQVLQDLSRNCQRLTNSTGYHSRKAYERKGTITHCC